VTDRKGRQSAAASKEEVLARVSAEAGAIRTLGVRRLSLFGSFTRGEQRPESDVDVLVEFLPERKSYAGFLDLADLLEHALGRRVELVTTEGLSPYLGPAILAEAESVPLDG
jgi:uncharacterized protein